MKKQLYIYTLQKDQPYPIQWLLEKGSSCIFLGGDLLWNLTKIYTNTSSSQFSTFELMLFFFSRSIFHFHAHCSKGKQNHSPLRSYLMEKNTAEQWTTFHSGHNLLRLSTKSPRRTTKEVSKSLEDSFQDQTKNRPCNIVSGLFVWCTN